MCLVNQKYIRRLCFLPQSDISLLLEVFDPFSFNVITDLGDFIPTIQLLVFYLTHCFIYLFFFFCLVFFWITLFDVMIHIWVKFNTNYCIYHFLDDTRTLFFHVFHLFHIIVTMYSNSTKFLNFTLPVLFCNSQNSLAFTFCKNLLSISVFLLRITFLLPKDLSTDFS